MMFLASCWALLRLLGIAQLIAGKIVTGLAHFAAGLVKATGHLHAIARQALDDLIELVAQALLVLRQRIGVHSRNRLTLLAELALARLLSKPAALALAGLTLLALLALLPLLALLALTTLGAEGAVKQLTLAA